MSYTHVYVLIVCVIYETYGNAHNLTLHVNNYTDNSEKKFAVEGGTISLNDHKDIKNDSTLIKNGENSTHFGREGIKIVTTTPGSLLSKNATPKTEKIIPVSEENSETTHNVSVKPTTEKFDFIGDSKIKARKGAPKYVFENVTEKVSTTKPKKLKPTVTVGSDDDFQNYRKIKNTNSSILKNDHLLSSKYKPDFVLPIVLTILAVPLIAIILTVLYKRFFEWYQHRNYRRMDFLIDGIYNN